eukprot:1264445-Amphidinium_carterae.1
MYLTQQVLFLYTRNFFLLECKQGFLYKGADITRTFDATYLYVALYFDGTLNRRSGMSSLLDDIDPSVLQCTVKSEALPQPSLSFQHTCLHIFCASEAGASAWAVYERALIRQKDIKSHYSFRRDERRASLPIPATCARATTYT